MNRTTLILNEQQEVPGIEITGKGFSRDAVAIVDGIARLEADDEISVQSPELIWIVQSEEFPLGEHNIVIENPYGLVSSATRFQW